MADATDISHGTQPPPDRGHPMPRRTAPEQSVTLRHHRLARDSTMAPSPGRAPQRTATNSPRRNSSGESHDTGQSDAKKWFERSNRNPAAALDAATMDVDPPFFQKAIDSSNEEVKDLDIPLRGLGYHDVQSTHQFLERPTVTRSSSADDYRSVIDDLTIENKRLKEELKRYKQFGPDLLRKDKLFEIKVHGLPKRKKRELEATLRDFAASLEGSSEGTSQRRKVGRHGIPLYSSGESKHASSSSSNSRPADSGYATRSVGVSSSGPTSSGASLGRPSMSSRAKSSGERKAENNIQDTPDGLYPRHVDMTDKEKKKFVVRRLEQLFTGKIGGRNLHRTQSMPPMDPHLASEIQTQGPPSPDPEAAREAKIQPQDLGRKKARSRDNISTSNSNGDQTESGGNGGDGSRSGHSRNPAINNTSPSAAGPLPEQRPTRPHDLDPDRVQIPSENMDYIRHLGMVPEDFLLRKRSQEERVSPDADGWVYLNLLCNLAQLHMISVTPGFIRSAVNEMSTKFQLSADGRKIRWRGGTDGTKFSSDSSGDNWQKSPSSDSTDDGSTKSGQRKKQKKMLSPGHAATSAPSSKESKFGLQISNSSDNFHYKPLFVHQNSSLENSLEETGSQPSSLIEDSNPGNQGVSKWDYSGSGSSRHKKRRHDGAIIYYNGAPFCTDLSGDPGDMSPTTYMTSTGRLDSLPSRMPELRRTISGSSLPIRPLSDDPAVVAEVMDHDADRPPELVMDDEDSPSDDDLEFPWCEEPETVQLKPVEMTLEPCGLGGVLPEDHFAVVVITRRPILPPKGRGRQVSRSKSVDTAEAIARRLAKMSTSSPTPTPTPYKGGKPDGCAVVIEYLNGRVRRLEPVPLPPPVRFIPPFSTSSEDESDEDDMDLDDADEDSEISISQEMISQRANPHQSDNTNPGDEEELSSGDEEDEVDPDNDEGSASDASKAGKWRPMLTDSRQAAAAAAADGSIGITGNRAEKSHAGSSAATAGGGESGYNTSIEDTSE